jgi:C_GCAxxG_C_C family probable redox protein
MEKSPRKRSKQTDTKMINGKAEDAVSLFNKGFACSQSVLAAYAPSLDLETGSALPIAEAFAGGMGMAETCGAVTGALMVIGLKHGRVQADDFESKQKTRYLVKEFMNKFKNHHGSIYCKTLLNVDISTDEGLELAKKKDLFKIHCPKFVRDAVEILETIID